MTNLNTLAVEITSLEGLKNQVNIADTKEILRCLFKNYTLEDIVKIWLKFNK